MGRLKMQRNKRKSLVRRRVATKKIIVARRDWRKRHMRDRIEFRCQNGGRFFFFLKKAACYSMQKQHGVLGHIKSLTMTLNLLAKQEN